MATILRQINYGRYYGIHIIYIYILRRIHHSRYIAHYKNGHISTSVQRQELSIAASEYDCCNASPQ